MRNFVKYLILAAVAVFAMASCETKEDPEVALTGISVNPATLTLKVGATATLTVQYTPENATSKPEAEWKSSNPAVAIVAGGVVTAVAAGEATITATVENLTATAAVTVTTDEVPEDLSGAWSVIGKFNEWSGDVEMIPDNDGWYKAENVELVNVTNTNDGFKFRRDKSWDVNLGLDGEAAVVELDKEIALAKNGGNICLAKDAVYNLYLNPNAKLAKIVFVKDLAPANFDSPAWDDVPGVSNGTHGMFKFTRDENYAYFYTWRTREGRFDALWGDGQGYIYFAMDLDGDETNGESLNGNGPYDYIGYIYCFGGTADAPEIKITAAGDCRPSDYTVDNIIAQGKVNEDGAFVEYRVPLADLPKLPENFTITSWGNKDLSKVVYYVGERQWDYTPSAEYLAEDNVWKAVDANSDLSWYYNPNWAGELEAPATTFKESTYKIENKEATSADWQAQLWIGAKDGLLLDNTKKYTFSCKLSATADTPVYLKMYQKGVDSALSFETPNSPRMKLTAGEIVEVKVEDFIPLATPQSLLIDLGGIGANTTVYIKDIVLKVTGEVPAVVDWVYTPSEEYLADNNLWKAKAAGHEKYYYYNATGGEWNGSDVLDTTVPFLTVKESTYELDYPEATNELWQKQFFIFPDAGNEIPLAADKTYKLKVTLGTNAPTTPGFFKISKFDAANPKGEGAVIWEAGNMTLAGAEPTVLEHEISGVECENIIFVMAFGGNADNTKIYIKDITLIDPSLPADNKVSVTEMLGLEKGATVESKPSLVAATTTKGFIATDGTKAIYVFTSGTDFNGKAKVGDMVKFAGSKTVYSGVHEIEKVTALEVVSSGNTVTYPEAKDVTAIATEYTASEAEFVSITGTLSISSDGKYYNMALDGVDTATKQGSIVYPTEDLGVKALDGKKIKVTGYFNGLSGKGVYLNVIATKVEEVVTFNGITIDGDMSDWAGLQGATGEGGTNAAFKVYADETNVYFYVKRTTNRMADLWGGAAYHYYTFDLDNDATTGEELWGNGPYEMILVLYPYAGSADAPAFGIAKAGATAPSTCKVDNAVIKGVVTDSGVETEISIPRADLLEIPTTPVKVYYWSNKDGSEKLEVTL